MQKTIVTAVSAAASLMLIAGTLAPVAYGAVSASDSCTVRSNITNDELYSLAPGDSAYHPTAPTTPPSANPILVHAGTVLEPVGGTVSGATATENWGIICTYSVIGQLSNILFLIVGILSVVMIVYAAFLYLTASQDPKRAAGAHNAVLFAIVGIIVAIAAKLLPSIMLSLLGLGH